MKVAKGSWRSTRRGGSTLVEFAAVVPVLLLLLMGIMEFGWLVKCNMQISNAAREGARSAALGTTVASVKSLVALKASPMTITTTVQHTTDGGATYTTTADSNGYNNASPGAMVLVTVKTRYKPLTGVFAFLKNRDITAKAGFGRE
jgi:Flp pilus assembly protein TadG